MFYSLILSLLGDCEWEGILGFLDLGLEGLVRLSCLSLGVLDLALCSILCNLGWFLLGFYELGVKLL